MAVCSFIGHYDVYDADIEYRLQRAVADIIGRSDFCIFDSTTASYIEEMQQYITPERRTIFLDIGKTDAITA